MSKRGNCDGNSPFPPSCLIAVSLKQELDNYHEKKVFLYFIGVLCAMYSGFICSAINTLIVIGYMWTVSYSMKRGLCVLSIPPSALLCTKEEERMESSVVS